MLTRMSDVISCVFTWRLVALHETFAPLGGAEHSGLAEPQGIVWHEDNARRNANDVMICFAKAIKHEAYRDTKKFTFYADNCAAQNNNWIIYTCMAAEVYRPRGRKIFRIGTARYNWPMSAHASQAFNTAHGTDSEDLPNCCIKTPDQTLVILYNTVVVKYSKL